MGASQNESDSTFKVLVATDNHLGVWEKNAERSNDSFETFDEILAIAVEKSVDFILLGGDLFHENKPSRQCVLRCIESLKKYTCGDKSVEFDFLSDPAENFKHLKNPVVNYMDPNLNIAIPVFSIHGNHDDPSGLGQHCALELLSSFGLINYFGKTTDLKEINIMPLLLEKGETKFAIFGLSSIKDERLFRLFKEGKVKMMRPKEYKDDWFNLMVLHQNHNKQCGMTNHIPESFLDNFLDLVVWGHEHECILDPQQQAPDSFHVIQPGSSVATSLCAGEAVPKKVALLEVYKGNFRISPIDLKTIRPFVFDTVNLSDHNLDDVASNKENSPVENFVQEKVNEMIEEAKTQITGHSKQPKKPLIRLRVEYSNEAQMFNVVRFGHKFVEKVANPEDMILFKKEKKEIKKKDELGIDNDAMDAAFNDLEVEETRVEDLVEQYFASIENPNLNLTLLSDRGLAKAVKNFVEKDDKDALRLVFDHQTKKTMNHVLQQDNLEDDDVEVAIISYRSERTQNNIQQEEQEALEALNNPSRQIQRVEDDDVVSDFEVDDEMMEAKPARGRGSRGGRGGRAAANTTSTRGRGGRGGAKDTTKNQLDFTASEAPKPTGRGRGRGKNSAPAQQRNMQSFFSSQSTQKSSQSTQRSSANRSKKGVMFDSDSD